jgi:hypothetical protein
MNMNQSSPFPISDELLSAYIDGDVSDVEKQHIEFAIANDPEIAWQVETLRATVALLREMPAIPMPRSFVLHEDQVVDILQARRTESRSTGQANSRGLWQRLLGFLNTGNLALRNASVMAATLFVIITVSRSFVAGGPMMPMVAQPDQVVMFEAAPAPAAAPNPAEEAAPSIMMATGEGEESARTESQPTDTAEMPADAARTLSEEQPAAEDQAPSPQQAAPGEQETVQTMAFETGAAEAPPTPQGADTTAMRSMPVPQPTPATEPVPEAAESMTMGMAVGTEESADSSLQTGEPQTESSEAGMAQLVPASEDESSSATDGAGDSAREAEMGIAAASAETAPNADSTESSTAETATLDPPVAKTTIVEHQDDESAVTTMIEGDATLAPPEEPQISTLSMDNEAADLVGQPAEGESAAVTIAPTDRVNASWDVWQIMQIGVLVLSLILLLLWLGSRQRSPR